MSSLFICLVSPEPKTSICETRFKVFPVTDGSDVLDTGIQQERSHEVIAGNKQVQGQVYGDSINTY